MADLKQKISALPPDATPTTADLMVTVSDGGTGDTSRITLGQLADLVSQNLTDNTVDSEKLTSTVAFSASSTQSISSASSSTITSFTEQLDAGNDFNHLTGEFYVPYNGVYHFDAVLGFSNTTNTTPTAARIDTDINVNGVSIARGHGSAINTNADPMGNCSITYPLIAGDIVTVVVTNNTGGAEALVASSFSGFLVGRT